MRIPHLLAAAATLVGTIGTAEAAIVSGTITRTTNTNLPDGQFVLLTPTAANPVTVGADATNDANLYGLNEVQNHVLVGDLTVIGPNGADATLPAGTLVNSHYVERDPSRTGRGRADITVTFDGPILGVIVATRGLRDTDVEFGAEHVDYQTNGPRGIEQAGDVFTIAGDTISLNVFARAPDGFRVFTVAQPAPVPLPAAGWLMLAGLGGFAGVRGRVRSRQAS